MTHSDHIRTEIAVLGAGPGGSITACLLAEAGREVVLLEEGPFLPLHSCPPFSRQEMEQKYRNGGLTVALGQTKIAYVEGRCVGGGSEINSGLYHRTPPDVLEEWRTRFQVEALSETDFRPHFEANEKDLSVSLLPGPAPAASLRLHNCALQMGWRSMEVPRWFAYAPTPANPVHGTKQSMTGTFIPRALAAGAKLIPQTRVRRLRHHVGRWNIQAEISDPEAGTRALTMEADTVFIACGAIQTPALLQRSGLGRHAGATLHMHPTVKVVARYAEEVNHPGMGVPVHQVHQFYPRFSFGCSISSPPHLALALLDHPQMLPEVAHNWRHMAIFYAMVHGGCGRVRTVPRFRDPLVSYQFTPEAYADLGEALRRLCECLLAGGAAALYPGLPGSRPLTSSADLALLPASLPPGIASLMTIHLFSSCPMGEADRCVADSFGRVHGVPGLWIADASLLPGPPGVNPQGTIMAIVRRNVLTFLGRL